MKCYDIELFNKKLNSRVSYVADCFSVSWDGFLHVYSSQFGSCFVQITSDEVLSVKEFIGDDLDE